MEIRSSKRLGIQAFIQALAMEEAAEKVIKLKGRKWWCWCGVKSLCAEEMLRDSDVREESKTALVQHRL